jgi:hypothetical protein
VGVIPIPHAFPEADDNVVLWTTGEGPAELEK